MALASNQRLNLRLHRQRLNQTAHTIHSNLFTVLIAPQPKASKTSTSRFAILLSKKFHPLAVNRNRTKRLLTEIINQNLHLLPVLKDILIIPKKPILKSSSITIKKELLKTLKSFK